MDALLFLTLALFVLAGVLGWIAWCQIKNKSAGAAEGDGGDAEDGETTAEGEGGDGADEPEVGTPEETTPGEGSAAETTPGDSTAEDQCPDECECMEETTPDEEETPGQDEEEDMGQLLPSYGVGENTADYETWEFDTANVTTAGVPITYNSAVTMLIDWGDGSEAVKVASSADFTHTYSEAGVYHITVRCSDWSQISLATVSSTSSSSVSSPIAEARASIAKIYNVPEGTRISTNYTFYNYTELVEIPDNLFATSATAINATRFYSTFGYCTSLASIPENLFANNTAADDFENTFYSCTSITSIPENLFANNAALFYANGTFESCTALESIPENLFANNTALDQVASTFRRCTSLTSVPENLFANNTAVTYFTGLFMGCSNLATVPSNLFVNNTAVLSFIGAFADYSDDFPGCPLEPNTAMTCQYDSNSEHRYFLLNISSSNVSSFSMTGQFSFYSSSANIDAVYVSIPEGSTTETAVTSNNSWYPSLPIRANSVPCDYEEPVTATITASTATFTEGETTDITFTVTLSDASAYNGELNLTYSAGLSGPASVTCVDGSATVSVECIASGAQSITVTVPGVGLIQASTGSFDYEAEAAFTGTAWEFDTIANCSTVGVPISTANAYTGMQIDWGDGTVTTVSAVSDYVHTYSTAGQYHITVTYDDWESVELSYSVTLLGTAPIRQARANIAKVYAIPKVANTTFYALFYSYTSLVEVANNLFAYNTQVTNFDSVFESCSALSTIPEALFRNNTLAESFWYSFCNAESITEIPEKLFSANIQATDFSYCFYGCDGLTEIPEKLFSTNAAATTFYYCFGYNPGLTSLPSGLFASNTQVTNFSYCFQSCTGLTSLPSDLFANNTAVMSFESTFGGCTGLTELTSGLFANNTQVTNFQYTFRNCTGLTSLPSDLFANNTAVTSFSGAFGSCTGLTSLPSDLFANNTAVTNFQYTFQVCTGLTSLPSDLFANNTAVTSFNGTFYGCSGLTSLDASLFQYNTLVTNFSYTFYGCTRLTSLPDGLFDSCTQVTNFSYCFYGCTRLATIPSDVTISSVVITLADDPGDPTVITVNGGLFFKNTAVTNFSYCFYNCSALIGQTIVIGSALVTSATYFARNSGSDNVVYVPEGSTTETTFNSATSIGCTVYTYAA